jgi:hypothetical protein
LLAAGDAPLEEGLVAVDAAGPLLAVVVGEVELVAPFKQEVSPGLNENDESIKDRQYTPPD